jgi:SAM-dependent methyltransferase
VSGGDGSDFRYEERDAALYDDRLTAVVGTEATVDCLARLAGDGPALELGIGTGRVALPLARRGVAVHGIDLSDAMLERLRAKLGGAELGLSVGNFADVAVEGRFSLVYVVFDTFSALFTQDEQVRCFLNVAAHLAPGGVFVVEASLPTSSPDTGRFVDRQSIWVKSITEDAVHLDVGHHDPVTQRFAAQWVVLSESGVRLFPFSMRYAWPSELDLMARLAGLRRRERWGGWEGEPFSAASTAHVSVYERPEGG